MEQIGSNLFTNEATILQPERLQKNTLFESDSEAKTRGTERLGDENHFRHLRHGRRKLTTKMSKNHNKTIII